MCQKIPVTIHGTGAGSEANLQNLQAALTKTVGRMLSFRKHTSLRCHCHCGRKAASAGGISLWLVAKLAVMFFTAILLLRTGLFATSACSREEGLPMLMRLAVQLVFPFEIHSQVVPHVFIREGKLRMRIDKLPKEVMDRFWDSAMHVPAWQNGTSAVGVPSRPVPPPMNVLIYALGSRGDVQPMIPVAQKLQEHGHRVRVAAFENFRELVAGSGLEFFPVSGDAIVQTRHLINANWIFSTDLWENIRMLLDGMSYYPSLFAAATQPDAPSGGAPFRADFIVASSHMVGYDQVAEWLRVPVHAVNVAPSLATAELPHYGSEAEMMWGPEHNRLSYAIIEAVPWILSHGVVNLHRISQGLQPVPMFPRPKRLIPHAFMWSPAVAPKFKDWGAHVDITGWCFTEPDKAAVFSPPAGIEEWLSAGSKPIYFGFGSMIIDNPKEVTETIIQALAETGQRGIIQSGWGGFGNVENLPSFVHVISSAPHDWLLPRCKGVVHHGGSGTTSAGLKYGLPTTVVPFFNDQFFWANRVHAVGVAPEAIPIAELTAARLAAAIRFMLLPETAAAAHRVAKLISREDGVSAVVQSFYDRLPADFAPGRPCTPWLHAADLSDPSWHC